MSEMRPNFFIVGAPKAGTTALYLYLKQHPDVFMPEAAVKEPHYFTPELRHPTFLRTPEQYAAIFEQARGKSRVGEASVFYLYSKEAARHIREFDNDARIIVMLRDPVDMIYALHNEHFTNGIEQYRSFEDALTAEDRRATGTEHVGKAVSPELFFYRKIGAYSSQVERYRALFPRDHIHYIFFEDFAQDTAREYRRTLEFLGVDTSFQPAFPRVNESRQVRSRWLQRLLLARPKFLQKAVRCLSPTRLRHGLLNLAFQYNSPIARRPPLNDGTREQLRREFSPDVKDLARITGRDLSRWMSCVVGLFLVTFLQIQITSQTTRVNLSRQINASRTGRHGLAMVS
jgi:hypothetical protein